MKKNLLKKTFAAFAVMTMAFSSVSAMSVNAAGYPKLSLLAGGEQVYYAEPGEVVEVTYNVTGADDGWCSTGVHFNYDNRLEPELDRKGGIKFTRGEAGELISAYEVRHMDYTAYPEYIAADQNCIFIATSDSADDGYHGVIASFNFTVPENAQSGDVYEFEFWRLDTDIFTDMARDQAMQEYAFSHWTGAEIRIN